MRVFFCATGWNFGCFTKRFRYLKLEGFLNRHWPAILGVAFPLHKPYPLKYLVNTFFSDPAFSWRDDLEGKVSRTIVLGKLSPPVPAGWSPQMVVIRKGSVPKILEKFRFRN